MAPEKNSRKGPVGPYGRSLTMQTPLSTSSEDVREIGAARESGVWSEHTPREAAVFRPTRDRFARPL